MNLLASHNQVPQPAVVVKRLCGRKVEGYANVRCRECRDNIPFYLGDYRFALCAGCSQVSKPSVGNTHAAVPEEVARYEGGPTMWRGQWA